MRLKGKAVEIHVLPGLAESDRYAKQLLRAFEASGMVVRLRSVIVVGEAKSGLSAGFGRNREQDVSDIAAALHGAGIITQPLDAARLTDAGLDNDLQITVWPK